MPVYTLLFNLNEPLDPSAEFRNVGDPGTDERLQKVRMGEPADVDVPEPPQQDRR